jgi:hypothetical protein
MVEDSQPHPKVDKTPFLLLAWSMPPTATGMGVVSRNLASGFDSDEIVMLGQILYSSRIDLKGIEQHTRIQIPNYSVHWRIKPYIEWLYVIPLAVLAGCRAVRRYRLRGVVASFPNEKYLISGLLISIIMQVPYYPYFHNLYEGTRTGWGGRVIARFWQRVFFWKARRVLSMSQGMTDFFRVKYGIESTPLLHSIAQTVPQYTGTPSADPPYRLAFTGNINFTVAERIRDVIEAVGNDPQYEILLHSPVPEAQARETIGLWADNVTITDIPDQSDLVESLRSCDVMMLALVDRHGSGLEDDFRTQFPTRTLEMLISERPLLVVAPKDYFITRFFEVNGAGLTYTENGIDGLRDSIHKICTNSELRDSCVRNALVTAESYRVEQVAATLRRELQSEPHSD